MGSRLTPFAMVGALSLGSVVGAETATWPAPHAATDAPGESEESGQAEAVERDAESAVGGDPDASEAPGAAEAEPVVPEAPADPNQPEKPADDVINERPDEQKPSEIGGDEVPEKSVQQQADSLLAEVKAGGEVIAAYGDGDRLPFTNNPLLKACMNRMVWYQQKNRTVETDPKAAAPGALDGARGANGNVTVGDMKKLKTINCDRGGLWEYRDKKVDGQWVRYREVEGTIGDLTGLGGKR